MNLEFFFKVLTDGWAIGEILIALITTTGWKQGKVQDRGTQIILWVVIVASFRMNDWMHKLFPVDMPGSSNWLRPAALGILVLGLSVRAVAVFTLGGAFSANVAMRPGQRLQRSGLYALVRHPMYTGILFALLGAAVTVEQLKGFMGVALLGFAFLRKMSLEDAYMIQHFDLQYSNYSKKIKRLIPFVY